MLSARHAIRFRRRYETVTLGDCTPEILFINSKLAPGRRGRRDRKLHCLEPALLIDLVPIYDRSILSVQRRAAKNSTDVAGVTPR
jgi:hypothetical protein